MPGLAKKFLVSAAVDGLLLQAAHQEGRGTSIRVEYGSSRISPSATEEPRAVEGLEVHGIIGLLNLVSSSYLIFITRREQVAELRNKPIFRITDVTLIPLESRETAHSAIVNACRGLKHGALEDTAGETDNSDFDEDAETSTIGSVETVDKNTYPTETHVTAAATEPPTARLVKHGTSFAKNVVQDKGKYGRFASRWFSSNGSNEVARRQAGISAHSNSNHTALQRDGTTAQTLPKHTDAEAPTESIEHTHEENVDSIDRKNIKAQHRAIEYLSPRILRSAQLYFSSSGFYFSYDFDISRSSASLNNTSISVPLWKQFEPLFFWNKHLVKPLIDAGQDAFVLPIIQGFVGQRAFSIAQTTGNDNGHVGGTPRGSLDTFEMQSIRVGTESKESPNSIHNFLLTLISRRSVKRAGLRYLRRGIDDNGNVANSVETEQILSQQNSSDSEITYSLLQLRGSIPLFFSQSPYSFKPLPVMFGSESTNRTAFKRHFSKIIEHYGDVQAVSLVDMHGTEFAIGEAYKKEAKHLNESGALSDQAIGFEWFDFHGVCKGMRFEKISILLDKLNTTLESFGWTTLQGKNVQRQQKGILRVNCMDCLDRTNVVQSAVAGRALQEQLSELGLNIDLQSDSRTQWFNTLWADNGDAISKQYAGTAALKGDFTRTRKRNWTGALADFSLTLNRYYNNIFGDYFLQTNIDYFLGLTGPAVFDEFETNMASQDYALDMKHVRENAIDTCIKIALEDPNEVLVGGWTLSCPGKPNTLRALPFEESVLLLTDAALYFCRFNWETEKIASFERVDMLGIKEIWRGVYITSTLGETQLDELRNIGFAVKYDARVTSPIRVNTRSMSVVEMDNGQGDAKQQEKVLKSSPTDSSSVQLRLLAFKALPPRTVAAKDEGLDEANMSQLDSINHITDQISKALHDAYLRDQRENEVPEIEEKDLINAVDAKKSTGYLESLGYSLKKMVWS